MIEHDVIIAGGGMVGASLGHALARAGLRVAVVEAVPHDAAVQPSYDDRAIALAYGTRRILEELDAWAGLAPVAEPIREVHVSDRGSFGFTRLDARDEGVEALGYVATARDLGRALLEPLAGAAAGRIDVDLLCPARVAEFRVSGGAVEVTVVPADRGGRGIDRAIDRSGDEGFDRGVRHLEAGRLGPDGESRVLTAALLVAADGGRSAIRERLGIPQRHHAYGHHAVVANVTPTLPHRGVAYERFTDSGPLALLPMTGDRCGLVWTVRDADLPRVLGLDDRAFLASLQERFGFRLGRFAAVGRRSHYPLELRLAQVQVLERVAIVGNAAHTVHPIAGQGFNLGIRDVAALAERLVEAHRNGQDLGDLEVLRPYADARRRDHRTVVLATDGLARLFVNPLAPLRLARNLGMLALDALPPFKHLLARVAMGLLAGGTRP